MRFSLPFLFLFLPLLSFAQSAADNYDFSNPQLITEFNQELAEISGLAIRPGAGNELLAVQDELGQVYRLEASTGDVLETVKFWKEGDYEGISAVGEEVWVVKSTGTLYRILGLGTANQQVEKYNTLLTGDNDVEGLSYDPAGERLLLACKDDARNDGNDKDGRYLFAFDLRSKTLLPEPVFKVTKGDIENYLEYCGPCDPDDKLKAAFAQGSDYKLSPSALAIHPQTGDMYLASSHGRVIIQLSSAGKLMSMARLPKGYFPQPEGLAFAPDGTLYISTEASKKQPASLYKFNFR